MVATLNFYIDDSGTRHPDRKVTVPAHGRDWFGLGGVLVRSEDEPAIQALHEALCTKWNVSGPLHSAPIRSRSEHFAWLGRNAETQQQFMEDLRLLCCDSRLIGTACVIDRPCYNQRYRLRYGTDRWPLCKTAFTVAVERAAKFARMQGRKLRVFVERSDKETERNLKRYFEEMKTIGLPFAQDSSAKYGPLLPVDFKELLYEFRTKTKQSRIMQIADLYLWPICIGGYDPLNRAYQALRLSERLIDDHLAESLRSTVGVKYSCFDFQHAL